MLGSPTSIDEFVRTVVRAEQARDDADELAVAQRLLVRSYRELVKTVGAAGVDVMLTRSLAVAQRNHPVLSGVTAGEDGKLLGLESASDRVAMQAAVRATVGCFIELVVSLIGEDLATQLLRNVWSAEERNFP